MNKEIRETAEVKSLDKFNALIDRFGEKQEKVELLIAEQKSDKRKIEEFARLNGINYAKADRFALRMREDEPRLVRTGETTAQDVIVRLKARDETAGYVHEDYDSSEIKEYLATVPDPSAVLTELGLALTEQKRKAFITPLKG